MGFNIYKEIPKIKDKLAGLGYKKNIPAKVFARTLMLMYGMKVDTTRKWISNFEETDIIKINKGKVNFLWKIGRIVILKQNMIIVN